MSVGFDGLFGIKNVFVVLLIAPTVPFLFLSVIFEGFATVSGGIG